MCLSMMELTAVMRCLGAAGENRFREYRLSGNPTPAVHREQTPNLGCVCVCMCVCVCVCNH